MYKMDFKIFQLPMSGNSYLRMHWAKRARYNKEWYGLVYYATIGKTPEKPLEHCSIRIERYSARILIDADNFLSGCKPLLDSLTVGTNRSGIIKDDCIAVIGVPQVSFFKTPVKGSPYIHVFIQELNS